MSFFDNRSSSSRKMDGVMVGIVTDNEDPEGLGRVKVNLPLREVPNETDWIRIATLMGGGDRGSLFIPEVGDEVLVAFHLGEVRQPYVIGMLWSQKNPPPAGTTGLSIKGNDVRKIKTRKGHELAFDDGVVLGKVTLKTGFGQKIELDDLLDTVTISDATGANQLKIEGLFGKVTLKNGKAGASVNSISMQAAPPTITIKSGATINLEGAVININSLGVVNIEGKAGVNIKSPALVTVNGSIVKIN